MAGLDARRRRFLSVALRLVVISQLPAALCLWIALGSDPSVARGLVWPVFLLWMNLGLFLYVRHNFPERPLPGLLRSLVVLPFFVWFCMSGLLLMPGILLGLGWGGLELYAWWNPQPDAAFTLLEGHAILRWAALIALAGAASLGFYGTLVRRNWVVTRALEIPIRGLDPALDGLRIVQLSDLHIGNFASPRQLAAWVRRANALEPDLTVVTGDLLASGDAFVEPLVLGLSQLRAREGVTVIMGNHDYWVDGEELPNRLVRSGLEVLRNGGRIIRRGSAQLYLAGVDDTWSGRTDLDAALQQAPAGVPIVLLAHDPVLFREAARRGVALTLSGHTHGGQIGVPFRPDWNLSARMYPQSAGHYQRGASHLYVHRGMGTTGPPVRLGAAPELVLLTLRCAPDEGSNPKSGD